MTNTDNEKDYYYVTYHGVGFAGAVCLPQHRGEDGFNFIEATKLLINMMNAPLTIQNWKRITRKRADQFNELVIEVIGNQVPANGKVRHLHVVKKEDGPA